MPKSTNPAVILTTEGLQDLIELLLQKDYCVIGPTARDGAIVYDELTGLDDLPAGWTDHQDAGTYRLS